MTVGWEYRRDGNCLIANDFLESESPVYLGWVLFVGIIEEGYGGDLEYRVRSERGCEILNYWGGHQYRHRISTKLAGWLDIVGQSCRKLTFVRVVLLLVGLWHCGYQGRCSEAAE